MITEARVLHPEWTPTELIHRNPEKNQLRNALQPVIHDEPASNILITGPSGAGKTCLARYTVDRLEEQAPRIDTGYVNCWTQSTPLRTLHSLLDDLGRSMTIHRTTPTSDIVDDLRDMDGKQVCILDEVDQLGSGDVLRQLIDLPNVTWLLATNDYQHLVGTFEARLQSRLRTCEHVEIDAYSVDSLTAILRRRADVGLRAGAVSDDVLRQIADEAVGNARDAISGLRQAAKTAERAGAEEIESDHVQLAMPRSRYHRRKRTLGQLQSDQRLLYDIINEYGEIAPGTLYDEYQQRASSPVVQRTLRNYLSKLDQYNLIDATGTGPNRRYVAIPVSSTS